MAVKQKSTIAQKFTKSKWNTRKLIGFGALFLGSLLLCFTAKVTGTETYQFWVWLFGLYVAGNIGSKVTTFDGIKGKFKISSRK